VSSVYSFLPGDADAITGAAQLPILVPKGYVKFGVTSALKEAACLADLRARKFELAHHRLKAVAHLAIRARVFGQPSEDAVSVGIRHVSFS
jgi:hypothetical protein